MSRIILLFVVVLFGALSGAFFLHTYFYNQTGVPYSFIWLFIAYAVNGALALSIFLFLYYFREKYEHQMGFLFMSGSLLKFLVFFILFYPVYKADGIISRTEFGSFFIPYILALVTETIAVSKMLNRNNP